jgi:dinuclear metal center YbgI/SA1388 family protein
MQLTDLVESLDEELRTADYADLDASANGLQVGPDEVDVSSVAFAVDAAVATMEAAADADADLLVTHHGISWGGIDRVTGIHYRRVETLLGADLALYVSHLPLDGHQRLGNAAGLADHLELEAREPFGEMGPEYIGQRGTLPEPTPLDDLVDSLGELDQGARSTRVLDHGPDDVRSVAIVTGSGSDWLDEAVDVGADVLVTGEGKQNVYHEAREAGINVLLAGHYATETFGVRSLAEYVSERGPETVFVDHPTGL